MFFKQKVRVGIEEGGIEELYRESGFWKRFYIERALQAKLEFDILLFGIQKSYEMYESRPRRLESFERKVRKARKGLKIRKLHRLFEEYELLSKYGYLYPLDTFLLYLNGKEETALGILQELEEMDFYQLKKVRIFQVLEKAA